ncbi:ribonucleoside triphosphate reductase [Candidatus Pacearchaeota archaeon]|nr:MAG: ribonucleoside triphosphate reductase [Candidatus Pacearchaeota archaeon]
MIKGIKKRDGRITPFNQERITKAIFSAATAVAGEEGKEPDYSIAQRISDRIVGKLEIIFGNGMIPTVEQIQDLVERQLMEDGYSDTAKAYILYREKHKELRERSGLEKGLIADVVRTVKDYTRGDDWEVRENANSGSIVFQGLNAHLAAKALKTYALNEMYGKEDPQIKELHEKGAIHIHDLGFPLIAYCCGHSIKELIKRGFGEVSERVQSAPAKHLETIVAQMVNYIGTMQGEFAGAQAFSSVDTFLAPFVRADNLSQEKVDQYMQMLIYGLNVPSRWGWQAPFSNLTFDLTVPEDLKNKKVIVGGEEKNSVYGEYQREIDMINLAFLKNMMRGDKSERIFTFPIPTYNITKDFKWNSEVSDLLFEVTGKYGIPYFQNYIGSGLDPGAIRAMCCRLNLDQNELINRPGNMWGPGDSTGSIGVVTINMNRVGYEAKNEKEFFEILGHRMDIASKSLEIKREKIENLLERGFVPYTKSYLGHFMNHFSTIGLCGMNEACINFLGEDISTPEGKEFTVETLKFMRERIREYQIQTGNLYNLEATPAESTAYRLAKKDKELYPHIRTSGKDTPFLTNSTQLPVDLNIDLFSALRHQEDIQVLYNGGTIFHTFLGERINGKAAKKIVRKIAEETQLPYFSITPLFSICNNHGYLVGKHEKCPTCNSPTEIYDRIVGYLRPVSSWNEGKQEEFRHRGRFKYDL